MANYRYIQDRRTGVTHRLLGVVDNALTEEGIAADAKVVGDALATKAEVDGSYESMTVGNAEQLISSVYEEDSVPYTFRTSGGSIDIGDREEDKIIGGTVAWNQLATDRAFTNADVDTRDVVALRFGNNNLGNISTVGTYVFLLSAASTNAKTIRHNGDVKNLTFSTVADIIENHKYIVSIKFTGVDPTTVGGCVTNNMMAIDLTQMFGSTIADYIYALEQTTPGAGVAWFKKLFPKDYYEYNPGELLSVSDLQSHDMVGFNQWDEEWEAGGYSQTTGEKVAGSERIRSKNALPCIPNATYYFGCVGTYTSWATIYFYDADMNFLNSLNTNVGLTFVAPNNARYMNFNTSGNYGTPYNHDICINLHWDGERDGEYEPYKKWSYPLDDSLTLRGIPKLDSDNKLYYDGDVYESDGTVTRRYALYDGTWNQYAQGNGYIAYRSSKTFRAANYNHAFANIAIRFGSFSSGNMTENIIQLPYNQETNGYMALKEGVDPSTVKFIYEKYTPTTEQADPYQNPQIVDDFGTEEYVTTSIVPVGHETKYQPNLRAKLEMAPDSPDSNGTYVVKHENGENTYIPLTIPNPFPAYPYTPGNYRLQLQVTENSITPHWVADN